MFIRSLKFVNQCYDYGYTTQWQKKKKKKIEENTRLPTLSLHDTFLVEVIKKQQQNTPQPTFQYQIITKTAN